MPLKVKDLKKSIKTGRRNSLIETIKFLKSHPTFAYRIMELNKHVGLSEKGQSLGRKLRILGRILETLGFQNPIKMELLRGKTYVYWGGPFVQRTGLDEMKRVSEIRKKGKKIPKTRVGRRGRFNRNDIIAYIKSKQHTLEEIQEKFNLNPNAVYYWLSQARVMRSELPKNPKKEDKIVIEEEVDENNFSNPNEFSDY